MSNMYIERMRTEVTELGVQELHTPAEVDSTIKSSHGTMLVYVNSVCGCATQTARPALRKAIHSPNHPEKCVSVFAGQDIEATSRMREYFTDEPPSSPSFALLRDGKLVQMIHRHQILHQSPDDVVQLLEDAFEKCRTEPTIA